MWFATAVLRNRNHKQVSAVRGSPTLRQGGDDKDDRTVAHLEACPAPLALPRSPISGRTIHLPFVAPGLALLRTMKQVVPVIILEVHSKTCLVEPALDAPFRLDNGNLVKKSAPRWVRKMKLIQIQHAQH